MIKPSKYYEDEINDGMASLASGFKADDPVSDRTAPAAVSPPDSASEVVIDTKLIE
jgi:hypothetical protein